MTLRLLSGSKRTPSGPKVLSICIPTFNRLKFLCWTLTRLQSDFPDAEIIVSDNASTDGTSDFMFHSRVRYHRQPENVGAFPNMLKTLELASGKYAVYCADDDYLLPVELQRGIDYLDAHPEVAAYCAPCELYLENEQRVAELAYRLKEPHTFTKADGMELFNFVIASHVWPEHIIYRTPVPLQPRTRAYWAFVDLPHILERGAIHFSPQRFYRNLVTHPVGHREKLGDQQFLTDFDEYRSGLEVMAYDLMGEMGYRARRQVSRMIDAFMCERMHVARLQRLATGNQVEADILGKRLAVLNPCDDAAVAA